MTQKHQCVECCHCETRSSARRTQQYCLRRRLALPANVTLRPACDLFEAPRGVEHWGP